jgi:putative membrane protein
LVAAWARQGIDPDQRGLYVGNDKRIGFQGGLAMATGAVSTVIRARLVALAISLVFTTIAALPVLAQQQPTQNVPTQYPYGYGPMMGGGWGWHAGFVIACTFFAVLAIIGVIAIFVWLVRWSVHGFPFHRQGFLQGRSTARDILEERFARGEIDKAEFEDKRRTIGH